MSTGTEITKDEITDAIHRWAPLYGRFEAPEAKYSERTIYRFLKPDIIWKIYPSSQASEYMAERTFYHECTELQNNVIPRLYASGQTEDGRFVLVLSNAGRLRPMENADSRYLPQL
jgi:hypothetical protein